ncbi:male-specific lethal 3 homolog isoform X2 [Coccinella septempunctata]|uniref:male-specific lethal 3 homolog isoform X2 n=1 Tax=Coccinella septempunctata TaxID=41139 RepID=UPI001D07141D|nr:male-specific lethal 3 homolog isoform X2 [Coccinella septempunctata]
MLTRSQRKKSGAYLYRKDRKKPTKKANEGTAAQSSEDGSSGSPARMDTDEGQASSSSEDESSTDGEYMPVEITPNLKQLLTNDYYKINNHKMLHILPCEPNVATILEIYFKHYVHQQMSNSTEKTSTRNRSNPPPKPSLMEIHKTILSFREFLDGVRIYFDNYLNDLLLYKDEKGPNLYPTSQAVYPSITSMNPVLQDTKAKRNKKSATEAENGVQKNRIAEQESNVGTSRKKSLRSYANQENQQASNGSIGAVEAVAIANNDKPGSSVASSSSAETSAGPSSADSITWKALPDFVYNQRPLPPCLVYGATHLTRLMVKISDILAASTITQEKLKVVVEHLELLIDFLSDHSEWFGDKYYRVA